MRQIDFVITSMHGEIQASGTSLDLLAAIPSLLSKYVPTATVVNSILASGENDAGMSGGAKWEPFQLDDDEYETISAKLVSEGLVKLETPNWVQTFNDWSVLDPRDRPRSSI